MSEELVPENPEQETEENEAEAVKQRKNGLYPGISDELADNMKSGWADTEQHGLQPIAQAEHTAARRAALSARFPGERLVIPAGNLKTRSNDTEYAFRASTEYAYLTGDQTQDGVLVLEPKDGGHEATLYLLPRSNRENGEFWLDGQGELWVGRRNSLSEAEQLLSIPTKDVRELTAALTEATGPVRNVRGHDPSVEAALTDKVTAERDEELRVYLSEARLVKDAFEIAELQKACDATARGFEDVVRSLDKAEATSERFIEGTFFLRARIEGNDIGYASICAAGPHATTLHWVRNDGDVRSGELLLLDAGVETNDLYTADVTRTLPINGTFSPLQRKIYDAVYEAQEAGIAAVRPGATFRDFHEASQRVLAEKLVAWGLLGDLDVEKVLEARPPAPLDPARHGPHARHGRPRLRRRAHRGVRGRRPGAGCLPDRGAGSVLPGRRPDRARGVPGHRRPDRGRHPRHRGRQPEPLRHAAPAGGRGRGLDGAAEGLTHRRTSRGGAPFTTP
ncbi:Xaa-Pro dipeptidase [Streptomyces griseus subsp. griseus]